MFCLQSMKIVHFSDPHAGGGAEDWLAYFDKRWVGVFNYHFRRRFKHDLSKLELAVQYILDTRPDVAVCTGDLTSAGQPGEFASVIEVLKPLRDSDIPLIYMPGNHDCYVRRPKCVKAVNDAVEYLSRNRFKFSDYPAFYDIGDVRFLLLNTSAPSNLLCSWGFVKKEDSDWICRICDREKRPEQVNILLSHYPMYEDHPILRMRHRLFGQQEILRLIEEGVIDLSLCGHVHKPYLRRTTDDRPLEECAGSVTRNGSMVEINVENRIFDFRTITL